MSATFLDVAEALVQVGVTRGVHFDMNPAWTSPGGAEPPGLTLVARVPGQNLNPSAFVSGWSRDGVGALATPNRSCRLVFPTPGGLEGPDPPTQCCAPVALPGGPEFSVLPAGRVVAAKSPKGGAKPARATKSPAAMKMATTRRRRGTRSPKGDD